MNSRLHGIIPPLATPLASPNALDTAGLRRLVERQLSAGVHGLFILGTTGEGPSLSQSLRRELIEQTVAMIDERVPLFVGITDTSLMDAIDLACFAKVRGAFAAVAAPPFYFPAGQTELAHWYHQLADNLPLPLLLYNMPSCAKIAIELITVQNLVKHDNIIGIKDSSGDLNYLRAVIEGTKELRDDWPVFVGPEALLVQAMSLGAVGGVTGGANLCPELFVQLYRAVTEQDGARINELQQIVIELQELYRMGKYDSSYLKGLKCALELTGICSGRLAAPFDPFKLPERERVIAWLSAFARHGYLPGSCSAI